ncbi:CopM family metallochaperone [Halomonas sp. E19]|uniref:CopM family metallochaperone n=1 Tax=unclassified Halomonas TaxID=2609666 RepID=UPI00403446FC
MSHILTIRTWSALAVVLAGSALLAAPALAAEEEAQAQQQIEQAEPQQDAEIDDENEAADDDEANGDEADEVNGDEEEATEEDHAHVHEPDEHTDNEAVQAYREVNRRMHEDMAVEFTGNPDADFARGMIPHHQGAIDMANVVLMHGEDEAIRDLAREIIEAQEEEIAFLRDWLAKHGYDAE